MRTLLRLLLLLYLSAFALTRAQARVLRTSLWISGGADDLLMGGDEAPGWLSLSARIAEEDGPLCWIDHGGGSALACLRSSPKLRLPDILVPGETLLRSRGTTFLNENTLPWTLLNIGRLPQFPQAPIPFENSRVWEQADGLRIRAVGLLSEKAPLRIPPTELQPFRVLPLQASLNEALPRWRAEPPAFPVLFLPDDSSPDDSTLYPDFTVLVMPASARPEVISLDDGKRLRVTPGRNGRALIRVDISWDNVTGRFSPPHAEVVWVRAADPASLPLPDCARAPLRPVTPPTRSLAEVLSSEAELLLIPNPPSSPKTLSQLPDTLRALHVPVDHRWVRATLPSATARSWSEREIPGHRWVGAAGSGRETRVLLPDQVAAGLGGLTLEFRRVLDDPETHSEVLPLSSRERLVPIPPR